MRCLKDDSEVADVMVIGSVFQMSTALVKKDCVKRCGRLIGLTILNGLLFRRGRTSVWKSNTVEGAMHVKLLMIL